MPSVVRRAAECMFPLAHAKGITLDIRQSPCVCRVRGDAARLEQVMRSLLANALKFSPRESRVEVALTSLAGHARVSVIDAGVGIRPEVLPHIFDWFCQGAESSRGLGLGLAVAKHIVQLHGGSISAESDGANLGAAFHVHLPLARSERAEAEL